MRTMPCTSHLNMSQINSRSGPAQQWSNILIKLDAQSDGNIDASIASACLENSEDVSKSGTNKEVIPSTADRVHQWVFLLRCPLNLL